MLGVNQRWDERVSRKDREGESDDQRKINPKPLEPKMDVFPVVLGKCVGVVQHSGVVASPDTLLGRRKTGGKPSEKYHSTIGVSRGRQLQCPGHSPGLADPARATARRCLKTLSDR